MLGSRKHLSMVRESSALYQVEAASKASSTSSLASRSKQIHERALTRASAYRISEADLIESLREVDDDKTFEIFECTSLYQYSVKCLKLSEDVSCSLISIMRKSRKVPELTEAIRDGSLTASMAKKIAPVINESNKEHWLKLASTSTYKAVEKAVATENPKLAVTESIKYKTADRLELRLGVSEEWLEKLKLVKDLLSQKETRAVTTEEALLTAMEMLIHRIDPLEKAKRAEDRRKRAKRKNSDDKAERADKMNQSHQMDQANTPGRSDVMDHSHHFDRSRETDHSQQINQSREMVHSHHLDKTQQIIQSRQMNEPHGPHQTDDTQHCEPINEDDRANLSVARRMENELCRAFEFTIADEHGVSTEIEIARGVEADFKLRKPRQPLTAELKHFVMLRDERRCSHRFNDGTRCEERRWLDVHHLTPLSNGGTDAPENLATLCSTHHSAKHRT